MRAIGVAVLRAVRIYGNDLLGKTFGQNLRAMIILRNVKVIQIDCILGVVIASADALATVSAGGLNGAKAIRLLAANLERRRVGILPEKYVDIHQF